MSHIYNGCQSKISKKSVQLKINEGRHEPTLSSGFKLDLFRFARWQTIHLYLYDVESVEIAECGKILLENYMVQDRKKVVD